MGRFYTIVYTGTITNSGGDADLFEIQPAANKPCFLRGWILSQISEVGDAAEEGLRYSVIRLPATFTSGSGGSSVTPQPCDPSNTLAAGFTAKANNTTVATTSSTAVTLGEFGWNVRMPEVQWFPDERFAFGAINATGLVIRLQTTVADDITACLTAWVEEI